MISMDNLEKALLVFLKKKDAGKMSILLRHAIKRDLSYKDVEDLLGEDPEDILTLSYGWRLVLPTRAARTGGVPRANATPRKGAYMALTWAVLEAKK